jgi:uncharacterized membrane protein
MIELAGALWAAMLQVEVKFPENAMATVEIVLRTLHFLAGITWIGLLYFFNLVNVPVMKQLDGQTKGKVIPVLLPKALWWFRWGAVVTVLVGLLYFIIYLMRDAANANPPASWGGWLGWWFLVWVACWAVLFLLLKNNKTFGKGYVLAIPIFIVVAAASWLILCLLAHPMISSKSLSIGVGGGLGLVMLLNVWGIIWRCQKKIIDWTKASVEQGTPMPPEAAALGRMAFLASRTNAWLSIPMLFFMAAASHYSFLSGM